MKEPFWLSVRFWVSVLTPLLAALLAATAESIPFLNKLDAAEIAVFMAGLIVSGLGYVLARTFRNRATN